MPHTNRSRLVVDTNGNWRLYTNTIPSNSTPLGTVTRDESDTGALVRIEATGVYAQVNSGIIRSLDGRKVAAALGTAGRPSEMTGGKKVNTYLDAESISIAARLGNGNVSEGIRNSLKQAAIGVFQMNEIESTGRDEDEMNWHCELTIFTVNESIANDISTEISLAVQKNKSLYERELIAGSQALHQIGDGKTIDDAIAAAVADAIGYGKEEDFYLIQGRIFARTKNIEMDAMYIVRNLNRSDIDTE